MIKIAEDDGVVTSRECSLHRELINEKVKSTNVRVDGILEEIQEVRLLQRQIYNTLIAVAVLAFFTLVGVLLGRTIDLGWFLPH